MKSRKSWLTLGILLVAVCPSLAQDPKQNQEDAFWSVRRRQEAGAAAQLVWAGDPWTMALMRLEGLRSKVWREPEFLGDTAPDLNAKWLGEVKDNTPMPDMRKLEKSIRDQIPIKNLLDQALIFANDTPLDAFVQSSQENAHVAFGHLYRDPARWRGKVIPIKGWLIRVAELPAPMEVRKKGIPKVYEGLIMGPTKGSVPFWIIFPILPDGLEVKEELRRQVTFYGYFLKNIKYRSAGGNDYSTPLLVGPTVILAKESTAASSETPFPTAVAVWVALLVVGVGIGLALLSWHFHRGDLAHKKRLAELRSQGAMDMLESGKLADEAENEQSAIKTHQYKNDFAEDNPGSN